MAKLIILNTPLGPKTALRPELAACEPAARPGCARVVRGAPADGSQRLVCTADRPPRRAPHAGSKIRLSPVPSAGPRPQTRTRCPSCAPRQGPRLLLTCTTRQVGALRPRYSCKTCMRFTGAQLPAIQPCWYSFSPDEHACQNRALAAPAQADPTRCRGGTPTPSRVRLTPLKLACCCRTQAGALALGHAIGPSPARPCRPACGLPPCRATTLPHSMEAAPPLPLPAAPYDSDPAASAAIAATMDKLDWPGLLRRVDQDFESWRQPSLLLFGTSGEHVGWGVRPGCAAADLCRVRAVGQTIGHGCAWRRALEGGRHAQLLGCMQMLPLADQFIELKSVFDWLESKRTCMRLASGVEAKLGHSPQVRATAAVGCTAPRRSAMLAMCCARSCRRTAAPILLAPAEHTAALRRRVPMTPVASHLLPPPLAQSSWSPPLICSRLLSLLPSLIAPGGLPRGHPQGAPHLPGGGAGADVRGRLQQLV